MASVALAVKHAVAAGKRRPGLERWMAAHSPAMLAAAERARELAQYDIAVLLAGERELARLVARLIHDRSPRRRRHFAKIHCGALTSGQWELEMFGGHPVGARRGGPGLLEWCRGGTLVLDEVDGLTLRLQEELIRVLREHCYRRVGGRKERIANVRILATSDADLGRAVEEGRFRGDLYARLNLFCLRLPPLRERWRLDAAAAGDLPQGGAAAGRGSAAGGGCAALRR